MMNLEPYQPVTWKPLKRYDARLQRDYKWTLTGTPTMGAILKNKTCVQVMSKELPGIKLWIPLKRFK